MQPSSAGPRPVTAEDVERIRQVASADPQGFMATARQDGTIQASMIRAGLFEHPLTGRLTVAALLRGWTVKLRHLRARPWATVMFKAGNQWITVEGRTSLIGPEDPAEGYDFAGFPELRRAVYKAAGGTPTDEWEKLMDQERRALVFLELDRVYANQTRPVR